MKIWIVSATALEFELARKAFNQKEFQTNHQIEWIVGGVGIVPTVFELMFRLSADKPDLLVNVGIAGAVNHNLNLGDTVWITREEFYQWGAEDQHGFIDVFSLGFVDMNQKPFSNGKLYGSNVSDYFTSITLKQVNGLTVQKSHGNELSINELKLACTDVDVESMEGAAVFYVAKMLDIPVLQLRSISNYVEPRNRSNWKIQEAIENLNRHLIRFLESI
jgi:futalosine hydrolase